MGKYTISTWIRDVISSCAFKTFLWANKMTQEQYFHHIETRQNKYEYGAKEETK